MANPRQRRKSRSSTHHGPSNRAKREGQKKLKRAPTIKGPNVLKEKWDTKLTLRQNYARLGLLPSMSVRRSGGIEPEEDGDQPSSSAAAARSESAEIEEGTGTGKGKAPTRGMGRIVRDAEGNVVDIIMGEGEESNDAEGGVEGAAKSTWGAPMEQWEGEVGNEDQEERNRRVLMPLQKGAKGKDVISSLEALSSTAAPVERHTSTAERSWLQQLVDAYGDDTEQMAHDRRLNVWQKTGGEIRRAIKKAGGVDKLRQA